MIFRNVIGYIEEVLPTKVFDSKVNEKPVKIMKFILNHDDGIRVQCNIFNDNIEKFSTKLKLHEVSFKRYYSFKYSLMNIYTQIFQIILLESVTVTEAKTYTKGNVPYDLNLQHYSNIEHLGEFSKIKELKPKTINFEDIPKKKGFISK